MPPRKAKAPANILWMGKRAETPRVPTFAELAEGLLFDLTQLAVGQPAPALEGRDIDGKGKPLEVVTVMAYSEQATVRQAVARGEITWRAVWDGDRGPIARRGNVRWFPTLYVLDQRGVIRSRDEPAGGLAAQVAELLK
jgi:hypothetical protein